MIKTADQRIAVESSTEWIIFIKKGTIVAPCQEFACLKTLKEKAYTLKRQCMVLVLAVKHPSTPWGVQLLGSLTLLYALSPIDLIPDFIPVLGLLDDLILVPIGIWLTIKFIPKPVWEECQQEVLRRELGKPAKDWRGIILILFIWIGFTVLSWWIWKRLFA